MFETKGLGLELAAGVSQMPRKETFVRTATSLTPTPLEALGYQPAGSPPICHPMRKVSLGECERSLDGSTGGVFSGCVPVLGHAMICGCYVSGTVFPF